MSIPQNFRLNNVLLDNQRSEKKLRGIQISSGNATSFVSLTNLDLKAASLEIHNKPQHLFLRDINVMQDASKGPALKLHFDLRKDIRGRFMARDETLLSLRNINAVNKNGQPSVDIDRIDQKYISASALNFRLPKNLRDVLMRHFANNPGLRCVFYVFYTFQASKRRGRIGHSFRLTKRAGVGARKDYNSSTILRWD